MPSINRRARSLASLLLEQPPPGVVGRRAGLLHRGRLLPAGKLRASRRRRSSSSGCRSKSLLEAGVDATERAGSRRHRCRSATAACTVRTSTKSRGRAAWTPEQVVRAHIASAHVVFMLGFSPGLPYIGGLDPGLAVPRRATPRTRIPAGTRRDRPRPDGHLFVRDARRLEPDRTHADERCSIRPPIRPAGCRPGDRIRFVPIDAARVRCGRSHRDHHGPQAGRPVPAAGSGTLRLPALRRPRGRRDGRVVAPLRQRAGRQPAPTRRPWRSR